MLVFKANPTKSRHYISGLKESPPKASHYEGLTLKRRRRILRASFWPMMPKQTCWAMAARNPPHPTVIIMLA